MKTLNPDYRSVPKDEAPRVILLDLWRTLMLSVDKEPIRDLQRILEHNLQFGAHGHLEPELDPSFLRLCLTTDIGDAERFLHYVAGVVGKRASAQALDEFRAILDREVLNLAKYGDVDETLEGLAERGYRLGVISNLWAFPERMIFGRDGFGDRFEHRIYSYEVGHRKPEPEIFLEACKRFGVEPGQCLMVGDHPEADVKGALKVGMNAALIDRPGENRVALPGVRVMRSLTELLELPSIR